MSNIPNQRRSLRIAGYDYSREGAYFVTVCAQGRRNLFGNVINGHMVLSDSGVIVRDFWDDLPLKYAGINLDHGLFHFTHVEDIGKIGTCKMPGVQIFPKI
jgi:hypothetical protein